MVFWTFAVLGCVFAYLQIGYWLGRLHWWSWHVDGRRHAVLAALLFPATAAFERLNRGDRIGTSSYPTMHVATNMGSEGRRIYLGIKAATWPLSLAFNVLAVAVMAAAIAVCGAVYVSWRILAAMARLIGKFMAIVWFCLTEGPAALGTRLVRRRRLAAASSRDQAADEDVHDRRTLPSIVPDKDVERTVRYRALVDRRAELDAELSRLEAEDAADHPDAFRQPPLSARAARKETGSEGDDEDVEEVIAPLQIRG